MTALSLWSGTSVPLSECPSVKTRILETKSIVTGVRGAPWLIKNCDRVYASPDSSLGCRGCCFIARLYGYCLLPRAQGCSNSQRVPGKPLTLRKKVLERQLCLPLSTPTQVEGKNNWESVSWA